MSGLSGEDRDYLENVCDEAKRGMPCSICERNQRLLALIDQQEKALEAADELARCVKEEGPRRRDEAADAYLSARDDGN